MMMSGAYFGGMEFLRHDLGFLRVHHDAAQRRLL